MAREPIYSDVDPDLRTDHQGNILILEDTDAINASVENILGIGRGELVMDPAWGGNVENRVGKNVNENSAAFLRMAISDSLDVDRRIQVDLVTVEPRPDDAEFHVLLQYRLNVAYIRGEFERLVSVG